MWVNCSYRYKTKIEYVISMGRNPGLVTVFRASCTIYDPIYIMWKDTPYFWNLRLFRIKLQARAEFYEEHPRHIKDRDNPGSCLLDGYPKVWW